MWETILIIGIIILVLLIIGAIIGLVLTWTGAIEAEGCQGAVLGCLLPIIVVLAIALVIIGLVIL